MIDALLEIGESVLRHRVRALATAFGVFWGIFMLTLLLAGGRGLRNGVDELFSQDAVNAVWITAWQTTRAFEGLGPGRAIQLDREDLDALRAAFPEFLHLSPRRPLSAKLTISYATRSASMPVFGVNEEYFRIDKVRTLRGRTLNALDLQRARKVVVIDQRARARLFGSTDALDRNILIGGIEFTVVGECSDAPGDRDTPRMFIPYSALAVTFDPSGKLELIAGVTRPEVENKLVRSRIISVLARRHRFDPQDESAIRVWFAEEEQRKVRLVLQGVDAAILVVGLGTLLSGMVGVSNILFITVRERAREFAIRRALGATARAVLVMVIAESVLLASVSGALGLLSGLGLTQLVRNVRTDYFRDPSLDIGNAMLALAFLVVAALVAGYLPAREAARAHPVDSLRRE